jgi:hypothetical protein
MHVAWTLTHSARGRRGNNRAVVVVPGAALDMRRNIETFGRRGCRVSWIDVELRLGMTKIVIILMGTDMM